MMWTAFNMVPKSQKGSEGRQVSFLQKMEFTTASEPLLSTWDMMTETTVIVFVFRDLRASMRILNK